VRYSVDKIVRPPLLMAAEYCYVRKPTQLIDTKQPRVLAAFASRSPPQSSSYSSAGTEKTAGALKMLQTDFGR